MHNYHNINNRQSLTVLGVTLIILGILAIALPIITSFAITLILGFSILVSGIAYSINAFYNKKWTGFLWHLCIGIISTTSGILLLGYPLVGIYTITLLIAALFITQGIIKGIFALKLGRITGRFWIIANSIISIILGFLIWYSLPASPIILGLLVAIDLFLAGWSMIYLASKQEEAEQW